jgi:tetratricopeptide (TPR) repeat protein
MASQGKYSEAIKIFDGISPATFDSLYYRGCARLELGDRSQICYAIDDFNQALQLSPTPKDPNIYYKRAFAHQTLGQYAEAIIDYSLFIQYNEISDVHVHIGYLSRGLAHNDLKQYDKALQDIEKANETVPKPNMYYTYCLARTLAFLGHDDKAKIKFNELTNICRNEHTLSGQTFHNHFYYGVAAYELNDYSTALEQLNKALNNSASKRELAETNFYIGMSHYARGEIEPAKSKLREALSHEENHTRALFRLGMMESQNEDLYSKALGNLTKAHELTPHKSDILYERGELHHKMGHLDACVRDKRLALQLERTDLNSSAIKHYCEVR